ncbi:medium-chain acyl-CoA ligase ACSF2, mitochondrial-like [Saccoglossus kowalevskii]|uniref:Acyl-CoA synthetase family member 2, mitochondrial-like n=1 Tax=Saccoglossus kowalevskii TaxID=10224 RepID=A0ABM0GUZ9_SACKO|nr:PREDICTED: acyl-CoA synthetase family member 2, mitochondrial-like [Saccoglossus kowalevskii]
MSTTLSKSYYHATSSVSLSAVTTRDLLDSVAKKTPEKEAYIFPVEKVRLTFEELQRQVCTLGTGLLSIGLKRGDTLGIISSCAPEYIMVQLAAAYIGVVLARFHVGLPNSLLKSALLKSECVALVVGANNDDVYNQLELILPDLKTSHAETLQTDEKSKLQRIITNVEASQGRWKSIYDIMNLCKKDSENGKQRLEETSKMVEFGDPYTIFYTSGSTGPLKGTLHSHMAIQNIYMMCADRYEWTNDDILLSACSSLSHATSEMSHIAPLILGMTSVILSPGAKIHDNVSVIQNEHCTVLFSTYPGLYNLLHHGKINEYDCSSLRYVMTSASTIPTDVIQKVSSIFQAKVLHTYGSSEALFVSGRDITADEKEIIDKVGRPFGHTEVKIVNEYGKIVPINTQGELLIRSNFLFRYYIHDEDKTKQVMSVDGWYTSGDLAKIDRNGYIKIAGRSQDVIMKGGKTMYYASLVESLLSHPNVKAAYIVPVPDEELQEDFCACVSLIGDTSISSDDLKDFYKANIGIPAYIPKYVMVFDDFPEMLTGKMDQKMLTLEVFTRLGLNKEWLVHGRKA